MMRISLRVSECRGGCQQPLDSPGDSAGENTDIWVRDMVSTRHSLQVHFKCQIISWFWPNVPRSPLYRLEKVGWWWDHLTNQRSEKRWYSSNNGLIRSDQRQASNFLVPLRPLIYQQDTSQYLSILLYQKHPETCDPSREEICLEIGAEIGINLATCSDQSIHS